MERWFNTAGPNRLEDHYTIDPFARADWPELSRLIDQKRYFVLHAPRQTGKTTLLNAMAEHLNAEGTYEALYLNVETAQAARDDFATANQLIVRRMIERAEVFLPGSWLARDGRKFAKEEGLGGMLSGMLVRWAVHSAKPTVLLLDEIDALVGDTLISVLRQLRDGYNDRPSAFPQSIILCGVRDVRDYRIQTSGGDMIAGGSCFNVKAESLRLGNFSQDEVRDLYGQHTFATGQRFDDPVYSKVMALTGGQPWLVNALARQLTEKMPELRDRRRSIGLDDLDEAKEALILRRDTHLDQLVDKLREDRVRRVIEPMLRGEDGLPAGTEEDIMYVTDLGLISNGGPTRSEIANEIYREVIPRVLTYSIQFSLHGVLEDTAFHSTDNRLDVRKMLEGFQRFYRENSETWRKRALYEEAAPQLLLQAWLQRVVNGGGQIHREYALGTGRADLLVRHFYGSAGNRREQRVVIEVKVVRAHRSVESTILDGLEQTSRYADRCDSEEAHLVVIDGRDRSWDEKIYVKECVGPASKGRRDGTGRAITVWGM